MRGLWVLLFVVVVVAGMVGIAGATDDDMESEPLRPAHVPDHAVWHNQTAHPFDSDTHPDIHPTDRSYEPDHYEVLEFWIEWPPHEYDPTSWGNQTAYDAILHISGVPANTSQLAIYHWGHHWHDEPPGVTTLRLDADGNITTASAPISYLPFDDSHDVRYAQYYVTASFPVNDPHWGGNTHHAWGMLRDTITEIEHIHVTRAPIWHVPQNVTALNMTTDQTARHVEINDHINTWDRHVAMHAYEMRAYHNTLAELESLLAIAQAQYATLQDREQILLKSEFEISDGHTILNKLTNGTYATHVPPPVLDRTPLPPAPLQ